MKDEKLREEIMLQLGYHRHKDGYRGKGLYFKVGGYDLTKEQADDIVTLIKTREIEARKDELLKADGFTEAEYTVKRLAQLESDK